MSTIQPSSIDRNNQNFTNSTNAISQSEPIKSSKSSQSNWIKSIRRFFCSPFHTAPKAKLDPQKVSTITSEKKSIEPLSKKVLQTQAKVSKMFDKLINDFERRSKFWFRVHLSCLKTTDDKKNLKKLKLNENDVKQLIELNYSPKQRKRLLDKKGFFVWFWDQIKNDNYNFKNNYKIIIPFNNYKIIIPFILENDFSPNIILGKNRNEFASKKEYYLEKYIDNLPRDLKEEAWDFVSKTIEEQSSFKTE